MHYIRLRIGNWHGVEITFDAGGGTYENISGMFTVDLDPFAEKEVHHYTLEEPVHAPHVLVRDLRRRDFCMWEVVGFVWVRVSGWVNGRWYVDVKSVDLEHTTYFRREVETEADIAQLFAAYQEECAPRRANSWEEDALRMHILQERREHNDLFGTTRDPEPIELID